MQDSWERCLLMIWAQGESGAGGANRAAGWRGCKPSEPHSHGQNQEGQTGMPEPFDLRSSSPVIHTCGWPVIFLIYGISSPGQEPEPLPEPSPVWLRRLAPGPCMAGRASQKNTVSPHPAVSLWQNVLSVVPCPLPYLGHVTTFSPLPKT